MSDRYIAQIVDDEMSIYHGGGASAESYEVIRSVSDWEDWLRRKAEASANGRPPQILCSSTLDFPEDSTENAEVIALARVIREPTRSQ